MTSNGSNAPGRSQSSLDASAAPAWLTPLLENVRDLPQAYRGRVPAEMLAARTAAGSSARPQRDAAVLILFSGPFDSPTGSPPGSLPPETDLLVTVRAATLRQHAGQAAFPGGTADPGDGGPVGTALREAREETGIDTDRLQPLIALDRVFIPPSGFHVAPVIAYSSDPGPVGVVDASETAIVARVPLRAFINPENRLMVYREENTRRFAGPAFLLNQMLVWGFTGQVISAILDVAGWAQPWNDDEACALNAAMALVGGGSDYREGQQ